jgi:hypothetical protein
MKRPCTGNDNKSRQLGCLLLCFREQFNNEVSLINEKNSTTHRLSRSLMREPVPARSIGSIWHPAS